MNRVLFPRIFYWLMLFIPLTVAAFYPTYFSKIFTNLPSIYHIHAFFMTLWIALVIIQPYLIYKKKTKQHKLLGKLSYVLMPLVLTAAWLMTRHSYFNFINTELDKLPAGTPRIVTTELRIESGEYMRIGIVYLSLLGLFYLLAVVNRKQMAHHATYMFAAALTLIGPTVDRIVIPLLIQHRINIDVFISSFLLIDVLLVALLIYQLRKGTTIKATVTALALYITAQIIFYVFPSISIWKIIIDPIG